MVREVCLTGVFVGFEEAAKGGLRTTPFDGLGVSLSGTRDRTFVEAGITKSYLLEYAVLCRSRTTLVW